MNWYIKRYLKIILKYKEIKGTLGTPEFEALLRDFYEREGENKVRWLFNDHGNAWFYCIDNKDYYAHNPAKQEIFFKFQDYLLKELESISD